MPKSQNSDITNFSSILEIEKLKEDVELQEKIKVQKRKTISLSNFKKMKDLPGWYRSLSQSQIEGVDSLIESIRDDMDQNTTHRCRFALLRLGLCPLEPSRNIKFVIHLSRGNDLAFLWFLMELFYMDTCVECDHEKTEYNVNQQLIMSAVAHLDMIVTLRELDTLLPKPVEPEPKKRPRVVKQKKKKYLSPLLEPLPRPKIGQSLKKRPPMKPAQSMRYGALVNDTTYSPPNMWNRWYAWPKEQQRYLDFGFDELEGANAIVSRILRDHLNSMFTETSDQKEIWRSLCAAHLKEKEDEENRRKIERVKEREEARRYFSAKETKKIRRKKITKQIEKDVKRIQDELDERLEYHELHTWIKCFIIDLIYNVTTSEGEQIKCNVDRSCPIGEPQENRHSESQNNRLQNCACFIKCDEVPFDFGHYGHPKANEIYFHAPRQNKPYSFDYFKIFKDDLAEKEDPIKLALNKALDLDEFADEDDAINSWVIKTWAQEVKKFNEEYEEMKKEEVAKPPPVINPSKEQMDKLLKEAMEKMKENPKFVLATLPDSHKHPSVRVWFRNRYNILKVTDKERKEALKVSKKIIEKVSKRKYKIRAPQEQEVGIVKVAPYTLRNYVYCKSKRILQKFYHEFKMLYLEDVRTFWQLMEHRHCSHPPWPMFYAYMPAREYDIIPFRPWKVGEYMDAKKEFVKRQLKKRMEAKYKL